jgi:MtN3 and saliva related transmembrane protein
MPETSTIVGYAASAASISAFEPQLYKVITTRDTKSLATPMWIAEVITFALWTTYGVLLGNVPIIVTNAVCGLMAIAILTMKLALPTSRRTSNRSSPYSRPA